MWTTCLVRVDGSHTETFCTGLSIGTETFAQQTVPQLSGWVVSRDRLGVESGAGSCIYAAPVVPAVLRSMTELRYQNCTIEGFSAGIQPA